MDELKSTEDNTVVNQNQDIDDNDTIETEQVDIEKLKELERNKSKALEYERQERKALSEKLAEYEAREKEELEKEKKKKGQYEELLSEKEELIKSLEEKARAYDDLIQKQNEAEENTLKELMEKVPKELLEENEEFLEDLKGAKKIKFLNRLLEQKQEDFSNKPKDKVNSQEDKFADLEAKIKSWKANPNERATFLTELRKRAK